VVTEDGAGKDPVTVILIDTLELPPHLSHACTVKLVYLPGFRMNDLLKLVALVLNRRLAGVG
jgi:hypothetical protein